MIQGRIAQRGNFSVLAFGNLNNGVTNAGLSCGNVNNGNGNWNILRRLSG